MLSMLLTICGAMYAQEATFDFDTDYATLFPTLVGTSSSSSTDGDFTEATTSEAVAGVTVTVSAKTSGSNNNRIWSGAPRLRLYSGTLTFRSQKPFTQIVFSNVATNKALVANDNTVSSGTLTKLENQSGNEMTWTGQATTELVITIAGNTQIGKAVVTVQDDVDPTQLIAPGISGTASFLETTTVTISNPNEGGEIRYAIDNDDATAIANGTVYSEPFTLDKTAVVYAVVVDGAKVSPVASKAFTKIELPVMENIAAFKALDKGTEAKLTLSDAQVLYVAGNDVYVRDASGAIDFYNTGITFIAGQKLNGSITGKYDIYNNIPELAKTNNTNANGFTTTEGTATAKEIGLDEVAGFVCDLVVVKGVTLTKEGNNYYATNEDGDKVQVYDKFKIGYETGIEEGKAYDITSIVVAYNDIVELCPIEDFSGGSEIPATPVASVADLLNLESPSANLELTLTDAQVVFNDNNYIYVRENGKAVCFYSMSSDLKTMMATNAVLNGKIRVDYEVYRLLPEVKANTHTPENTLVVTEGEAAVPTQTTLADVAEGKNVCDLVTLKATLAKETTTSDNGNTSTTYYLIDGDTKLVVVNNNKNLSKIDEGTEIEVVAISNTASDKYQLKLTQNVDLSGVKNITADEAEAIVYNLAGQRVNADYKGVVIKNGKKYLVK